MQRRRGLLIISSALLVAWLAFLNLGEIKASTTEQALASAIYFISCIPLLVYFVRLERNIPYLPIFGIFYFIYFGAAIFNKYDLFVNAYLNKEIIIRCLTMIIFGFISLLAAFYTPIAQIVEAIFKPLKIPWDTRKAFRLGVIVGFLGITIQYVSLSGNLPFALLTFTDFLTSLSRLGIAILFMLQLQGKLKLEGKLILWFGLFIPRLFLDIIGGTTFPIILNFMILFFLYFYYYNSVPWLRLIAVAAIFFVIFSVRDAYRELTWFEGEYTTARPMQKGRLYTKLIIDRLSGEKEQFKYAYEKLSVRTDYLITFAKVVEMTPDYIPYWDGYTYRTVLTSFIPRFLSPGKPTKMLGQEFGHRYGFLHPEDVSTAYNLPILVEMYINFGEVGVILGMFALGVIFRIFYAILNHTEAGEGGLLISAIIFTNLLSIESDFSLIFGNVIQYIILFYIILRMTKLAPERTGNGVR